MNLLAALAQTPTGMAVELVYAGLCALAHRGRARHLRQERGYRVLAACGKPRLLQQRVPVAVVHRLRAARMGQQHPDGLSADVGPPQDRKRLILIADLVFGGPPCQAFFDIGFPAGRHADQAVEQRLALGDLFERVLDALQLSAQALAGPTSSWRWRTSC